MCSIIPHSRTGCGSSGWWSGILASPPSSLQVVRDTFHSGRTPHRDNVKIRDPSIAFYLSIMIVQNDGSLSFWQQDWLRYGLYQACFTHTSISSPTCSQCSLVLTKPFALTISSIFGNGDGTFISYPNFRIRLIVSHYFLRNSSIISSCHRCCWKWLWEFLITFPNALPIRTQSL